MQYHQQTAESHRGRRVKVDKGNGRRHRSRAAPSMPHRRHRAAPVERAQQQLCPRAGKSANRMLTMAQKKNIAAKCRETVSRRGQHVTVASSIYVTTMRRRGNEIFSRACVIEEAGAGVRLTAVQTSHSRVLSKVTITGSNVNQCRRGRTKTSHRSLASSCAAVS